MIRITILLGLVVFSGVRTFAQEEPRLEIPKGSMFIAGGFFIARSAVKEQSRTFSYGVSPSYGYYFSKNWYVGTSLSYDYYKSEDLNNDSFSKTKQYGFSILGAKDFKISKNFFFELQPALSGYKSINESFDGNSSSFTRSKTMDITVNAGLLLFLNENFAIRNWLGGIYYSTGFNDDSNVGLNWSLSYLNFTFLYYPK